MKKLWYKLINFDPSLFAGENNEKYYQEKKKWENLNNYRFTVIYVICMTLIIASILAYVFSKLGI
jgi:hypothetical protein